MAKYVMINKCPYASVELVEFDVPAARASWAILLSFHRT